MKTFSDLKFRPRYTERELQGYMKVHISLYNERKSAKQAVMKFDNGYSVSVVCGACFYSNGIDTYEVAVMHNGCICYDTPITSNVIPYQTAEEVTEIMREIQELPKRTDDVKSVFDNYNFE